MLSLLLEIGGAVYVVAVGSLVLGLLRSAKAATQVTEEQEKPDLREKQKKQHDLILLRSAC